MVTARDLVRQVPAEWQERIKHRRTATFPEFVDDLVARTGEATWFWEVHDYAALVRTVGEHAAPERVHVVTVPGPRRVSCSGSGSPACSVSTPRRSTLTRSRANRSLGAEQVELLRRVNAALGDALPHPGPYSVDVKTMLAQRVLVATRARGCGSAPRTGRSRCSGPATWPASSSGSSTWSATSPSWFRRR